MYKQLALVMVAFSGRGSLLEDFCNTKKWKDQFDFKNIK